MTRVLTVETPGLGWTTNIGCRPFGLDASRTLEDCDASLSPSIAAPTARAVTSPTTPTMHALVYHGPDSKA